ncbi:acyltransferase family protein [Chryseobacterium shigense]|uniref:Peptidoglycan/LPS O-acetylase OafA/YrhL n=1 Tax=Chryseobacterium shigense TaxID=297244 RepID=A0A841MYQ7_9FLAO|nr:acyltransferase [Chryseobacterium shigense]MBB6369237.1 peptidoglycan/LPS O-acetylase OafA/YrhL [Chryseobacterium shigense]
MMNSFFNTIKLDKLYSLFSKELNHNRIFGLDILRFFAITTVIISHGRFIFSEKADSFLNYIVFDGVTIFFVLSGFLIGGILIKQLENNTPKFSLLLDFWVKRWFRTLPAYFLILSILTVCYSLTDPAFSFGTIKSYYIFCQNLYYPTPGYFTESWSLSVEEWFYLTVPFLIFILTIFIKLKPKTSVLITALAVLFFITFLRYTIHAEKDLQKALTFNHQVLFRLDSIMYGVIGAYLSYYYSKLWKSIPIILLISGISIFLIQKWIFLSAIFPEPLHLYNVVFDYSLTSIATLLLLPYLSNLKKSKYKIGNLITIISLISYSMYLTHMALIKGIILKNIPWRDFTTNYNIISPIFYFLYWALTITFSIILYKFFEVPTTNLREKFIFNKKNEPAIIENK